MTETSGGLTPMMRQYRDVKRRFPDYLLLFRLGDFYEMFFEDAEAGARLLQITLTSRQGMPMAGIPHHAADGHVARLVQAGRKIAICEQMEAPGKGKKLLRRDVVRVITPGTITDTAYLSGAANNFLLAAARGREGVGVALLDVSTGSGSPISPSAWPPRPARWPTCAPRRVRRSAISRRSSAWRRRRR